MAKVPNLPDYRAMTKQAALAHQIPPGLLTSLVSHESGFNPTIVSPAGAIGLGQLMPGTAQGLGVDPRNPQQNLEGTATYLQQQYNKFGRWDLALAAYNAGPGAVQKYGGIPPYAETQSYVRNVMGDAGLQANQAGGDVPSVPASDTGASPPALNSLFPTLSGNQDTSNLLNFARPSNTTVDILGRLGGTAAKVAGRSQEDIPLPTDQSSGQGESTAPSGDKNPYEFPTIPIKGGLINGAQQMVTGNAGQLRARFPNIIAQNQVDWAHVNNRLLDVVSKVVKGQLGEQAVVTMVSGYRSTDYNQQIGGAKGSKHQQGLAGDFYIDGHPIGEVIPPEVWARYGVRSGNTPGFFHGQPDPMHLDLVGLPIKGGKA